jgi:maltose alpha-D-glucosyltransferase / alpha-amylase
MPAAELPVLVLSGGMNTLIPSQAAAAPERSVARRTLQQFQQEVLPEFLRHCGWFSTLVCPLPRVKVEQAMHWQLQDSAVLLSFIAVDCGNGMQQRYFLPLLPVWEEEPSGALRTSEWTLAKIREHARVGVLVDAFADPAFCKALADCFQRQAELVIDGATLHFRQTGKLEPAPPEALEHVQLLRADLRTTHVIFGERLLLRVFRRAEPGVNPAVEMTEFLTNHDYRNVAPLLGVAQWLQASTLEEPITLMAWFEHVGHQGDAWSYTLNHLERYLNALPNDDQPEVELPHSLFNAQMRTLGRRVAQLHAVLSADSALPAFAPEPVTEAYVHQWREELRGRLTATCDVLQATLASLRPTARALASEVLARRDELVARIDQLRASPAWCVRTRYHGNLQLGEVLLKADDFLITGFEGGAGYAPADCRSKHCILRDVASLLRSFDLARMAALERAVKARPELRTRADAALVAWREQAAAALMEGYDSTTIDPLLQPELRTERDRLLRVFMLERTLHEVKEDLEGERRHSEASLAALLELCS